MKRLLNKYKSLLAVLLLLVFFTTAASAQRVRHFGGGGGPVRGYSYAHIGGPRVTLSFGGNPYYYASGYYYRPYGGYYRVVAPPIGIHVGILPYGYWALQVGAFPYFYYDGVFYRHNNNGYDVVDAPVGAEVPSLPRGAKVVVINGMKYYELDGNYYREIYKDNGQLRYQVAGKNGQLDTTLDAQPQAEQQQPAAPAPTPTPVPLPKVGDFYDSLPQGSKVLILNGQKYYVSPSNEYYQEVIDGNRIIYKVVALANQA
jgi:hypothetical protein